MAALPQCDAFGYIYDQAGDPAPDVLVTLKKVIDASGNSILLSPLTTLTDPAGSFHFTLPEDAAATISARASGLWNCPDGRTFKVPPGPSGELIATFLLPGSSSVVPPLIYVSDTLSLPRSSPSADGYLSAADYVRFDAATDVTGGVSSFASRTGDITPIVSDYQAFYLRLSGGALTGPLTLAADPTMPMQAATMQYVLAQLASATAGVASFNSRTGVVLPLAPDYASFYAPVTHAHTRSQITDLGVFSTSQPGLVPQPTSGDAAKVLTGAGTWVAQATGSGTGVAPGEYLITDFKASGLATKFTGTISSGSTTLTTTAASDFAIGQGIYIAGGGSGGTVALVTKVTAISGTTITLQDAALANVTAVANNVQHDDTAAIQAGIDYIFSHGGGTLLVPAGFYRLNGPLNDIGSLLKFPLVDTATAICVPITIRGTVPLSPPGFFAGVTNLGAILQTDVHNTSAAIIRAAVYATGLPAAYNISNISVTLKDLTFRTYDNPQISGVDLGMAANVFLHNLAIDAGIKMENGAEPTASDTYGLRCPRDTASSTGHIVDIVYVQNYYTGIIFAEQMVCHKAYAMRCKVGLLFQFSYHQVIGHAVCYNCPTSVWFVDRCVVQFCVDIQKTPDSTAIWDRPTPGRDFYDPTSQATGWLSHIVIITSTAATAPASITGLENMVVVDLAGLSQKIPRLAVQNQLNVVGNLALNDSTSMQSVSFGADDSESAGFRNLRVANIGGGGTSGGLLASLVSMWKLDEPGTTDTRVDSHGANNLASVASISSGTGKISLAAHWPAPSGNRLVAANNAGLQTGAVDYTFAFWANLDALSTHVVFVGKAGSGSSGDEYFFDFEPGATPATTGRFQFNVQGGGTYATVIASSFGPPATGQWYLVVGWHDQTTGTINIQINAGAIDTFTPIPPLNAGADDLYFGCYGNGSSSYYHGLIDEAAFWKGRILGPADKDALYGAGGGLPYGSWT